MMVIMRAYSLHVLAGSRKAIGIAIRNNKVENRFTALEWQLENRQLSWISCVINSFFDGTKPFVPGCGNTISPRSFL